MSLIEARSPKAISIGYAIVIVDGCRSNEIVIKASVARHALTDDQWSRLRRHLPKKRTGPKSILGDRLFVEAVLYRARTGVPWRDLPERFGPWKSVYNRFSNWARVGRWQRIFRELQLEFDEVGSIVDGSVVRAHQDASGGKGGSKSMLWDALEEVFRPNSTRSSIRARVRSTSR